MKTNIQYKIIKFSIWIFFTTFSLSQNLLTFDITENDFFAKVNATSFGAIPIKYANPPVLQLDLNNNNIYDYVISYPSYYGRVVIIFDLYDFGNLPSYDEFLDIKGLHILGGDGFGYVFEKGDFNNDGIDDLIVGNPTGSTEQNMSDGFAAIILGKQNLPLGGEINLSELVDVKITFAGFAPIADEFGASLSTLDFNGDGIDDIAVGAPAYRNAANSRGSAYIIFGRNNLPTVIEARNESNIVIEGSSPLHNIAMYLRKGNFNNDKYDDLIITSILWPDSYTLGKIWILFGGSDVKTYYQLDNNYSNLSSFSGTNINDQMGFAQVGDFNGDDIDDLFISASLFDQPWFPSTNNHGKVYGILGPILSGIDFGPMENYENKLEFALYPSDINFENTYMYIDNRVGICMSLFDINNDGFDDILLGADGFSRWPPQGFQTNEGGAFIFLGRNDSKKLFLGEDISAQFLADPFIPFTNEYFGHSLMLFSDNTNKRYAAIADNLEFLIYFFDISNISTVSPELDIPQSNILHINYPNPFNTSTTIEFYIEKTENVSLKVYDILGKEVITLVNEMKNLGNFKIYFDATHLPSGIYFYSIKSGGFRETKAMHLIR